MISRPRRFQIRRSHCPDSLPSSLQVEKLVLDAASGHGFICTWVEEVWCIEGRARAWSIGGESQANANDDQREHESLSFLVSIAAV
jgi:hypothetical protein